MKPTTTAADIVILLVEDYDGDALLIQEKLRISQVAGYTIERTASLAETVSWLDAHSADVILLDMNIGDSTGMDTVNAVYAAADYAAIVVLTGNQESGLGYDAIEAGAQDFLGKDEINARNLRRIVAFAISRRRFQKQQLDIALEQYRALELDSPADPQKPALRPEPPALTADLRDELLETYKSLLKDYLDSLIRTKAKPHLDMQAFVTRLGQAEAGPKDVLSLHVAALEEAIVDARPERARYLNTDGRLLALEVMGRLLTHYRTIITRHVDTQADTQENRH